jgi:hypothetical protein
MEQSIARNIITYITDIGSEDVNGFNWLIVGPSEGIFITWWLIFGFHKGMKFL